MKKSEFELCRQNGVEDITEVLIGFDGIVIANTKAAQPFSIGLKDLFLALAKQVPGKNGGKNLIPNPYVRWSQVNPALPDADIEVLGPAPTSGTRDAFSELVMEGGCQQFDWIKQLKKSEPVRFKRICHSVREDKKYIEVGENDNLIVQKLVNNPNALGIFGFSFLDQNADKLQGAAIDGVLPDFTSIANGHYGISRPLYFYVKNGHEGKIPGIKAFLAEFTSEAAMGTEGYLTDKGLIPLPKSMLQMVREDVLSLKPLQL
jgi:phosphate transport system substrate-binding protein